MLEREIRQQEEEEALANTNVPAGQVAKQTEEEALEAAQREAEHTRIKGLALAMTDALEHRCFSLVHEDGRLVYFVSLADCHMWNMPAHKSM